jgi:hypothetical protein
MPRRIYDFKCAEGHVTEKFVDTSCQKIDCPVCGQPSIRLVSFARPMLDVISGDFPGATLRWARGRQEKIKAERRYAESHGPA